MIDQTTTIQQLYVAFFNRPGDVAGEAYWESVLQKNGGNVAAIASQFAASSEYRDTFFGMSNDEIVNTLYTNLFGRPAESAGLQYWSAQLAAGTQTVSSIALTLLHSAQGSDADAVYCKVDAAKFFTQYVSQSNDPTVVSAYTSAQAIYPARAWLAKIVNTATLFENIQPNVINALLQNMNPVDAPTSNMSLTPGIDTLIGGSQPVGFNGTMGQGGTFNSFDTIKGGSGHDVLSLLNVNPGVTLLPPSVNISNIHTLNIATVGSIGNNADPTAIFDVTGISGLAALNVTSSGPDAIKAAGTTDVTVKQSTGGATYSAATSITGGAHVYVDSMRNGSVSVTGAAGQTSSVSISGSTGATIVDANASTAEAAVAGTDAIAALAYHAPSSGQNSISTVVLNGVSAQCVIDSDALSSLTLANNINYSYHPAATIIVNAATGPRALDLTLVNDSSGAITDATATKLKIHTTAASTGIQLNTGAATSISFDGTAHLSATINDNNASIVTLTGSGGVTDLTAFGASNAIFDATTSQGNNTLTLTAGQSYLGGSGASTITATGVPLAALNGGSSGNNSVEFTNIADTRALVPISGGVISNFQAMVLSGNWGTVNADLKLTNLTTPVTTLVLKGTQGNASTITTSASAFHLSLSTTHDPSVSAEAVTYVTTAPVANSSLTLQLGNLNSNDYSVIADGVSSLNIVSSGLGWSMISTLHASSFASAHTVTISGDSALDMSDVALQASSIDASKLLNTLSLKSGLTSGATIMLGGQSTTVTGLADAGHGDTITTSWSATDARYVVTEGAGQNVINLNDGTNIVIVGNGNNTITLGNHDSDSVTAGNGNNIIRVGDGNLNHITVGTGSNTVTLGHGTGQIVTIHGAGASLNTFTTITGFLATDNLEFDAKINTFSSAKITALNDSTATLQQFADYAVKNLATNSGSVAWFQYKGDTYVIENVHGSESNFTNGTDVMVKLTGLMDLSNSSIVLGQLHHG